MAEPSLPTPPPRRRHVAFGVAQVLLVAVAAWWVLLLRAETEATLTLERTVARLEAEAAAREIGAGASPEDVLPSGWSLHAGARGVVPADAVPVPGTDEALVATPEARRAAERRAASRRLMVAGEGALLVLLVGASVLLLTRLVLVERRRRRETQEFLARVSHEMKTPLAGLKALLQGVAHDRLPAERRAALLELGRSQAARQERLVDLLLQAGGRRLPERGRSESLDVDEFLRAWIARRSPASGPSEDRRLSFVPTASTTPLVARVADPDELGVVLDNLADNAFKYGATQVVVRVEAESRRLRVVVEDDGHGFAPEEARLIFRPFRRGESAIAPHGSGLGLAISRDLARRNHGDLLAASEGVGRGARFTLVLSRHLRDRPGSSPSAAASGTIGS